MKKTLFSVIILILVLLLLVPSGCLKRPQYSVSGYVKDTSGSGISDVTISFSGGATPTTTAPDGHWSKSGLAGSVTVTPSKTGYAFTPSSTTVTGPRDDVDFTVLQLYSVSGYVKDASGKGISGATISFGGGYSSTTTASDGHWSKSGLWGSVTVTPSKTGYTFTPSSTTVSGARSDVNFTGTYSVSGYVKDTSGKGISDVTISFSNDATSVLTDVDGYWSKSGLWGSVTVTASKTGYTFTPSSTTVTGPESDVNFTAFQPGTLKWKYDTEGSVKSSPAIGEDGTIYVGSEDNYLYALNLDGTLKWKYGAGSGVASSPVIGADGTIYVGSEDGYLYALNLDGTLKWRYETGDKVYSSPAIGEDGTIYVGSDDNYLYALNPNGTLKWKYETRSRVSSSPAIGKDGTIYVGSWDRFLYALNPDGTLKWKYWAEGSVKSSPAIGKDGTIYVGSGAWYNGYLYAINPDGTLKWKYKTEDRIYSSSPAIGKDGTIYVGGAFDGYLYAIKPNGTLKWRYWTEGYVYSSPAIGKDGTIYVGSCAWYSYLYAINGNSGGLASTPWPMFHHDVRHSGRK